ncbi:MULTISPECIES: PAS domain-containing sensor histidine kinase [unclassified Massilia]|uniref:hybrid sensor histidine kinase/response regulator n=1 Tax=unclassified Massilia TaxID=2609279 RepID=UPI0013A587D5|nr:MULTISPECIES: PAS domain-containing sensor histidine kinase [unclassified Massilia]
MSAIFLRTGGQMGERIAAHDWSATPLGPIDGWPAALRTALGIVLNSKFPNFLCWGLEFISFHNDAYTPLLGAKTALGRPFREVWSEAWDTVGPIAERAWAGEASYFEDLPVTTERYGYPEQQNYSFSYSPVRDEHGVVAGILCTVFETTGKVQAIDRMRHLNQSLSHQVASHALDRDRLWRISPDVMAAASLVTGRFLTVNPAFTEHFGWSAEEATIRPFMEMVHPDDRDDVARHLLILAEGTPLVGYETRVLHKDGSHRWVQWTISPEGELLYGVARDITAEKHQADALRQAEDALRQSQKMEAVGQLTGGLAHDFNNMLAGVAGHLELMKLRLRMGQTGDLPARIDAALGVTQRAAALTHRLLAFSRRQALDPKPTSVNALVMSMSDLVKRSAGPSITLRTRLQAALWTTLCDPNQLESALLNLANNARDAMPEGGVIVIETENAVIAPLQAGRYGDLKPGEYVLVTVRDSGAGMPPDVLARAFDPFFTTKPMGQGTGLGLSMVYGFARQSGGQVRIDSAPGQGTEVRMLLPRLVAEAPQAQLADGEAPLPALSRKGMVLVVDDEADIRTVMAEVLRLQGYTVLEAADAPQALRQLQERGRVGRPDMLVTDVGLPNGMNGRQLADQVRMLWPQIPVLLVTGYAESTVMRNETLPAQMELLTKPFAMAALVDKVGMMLAPAPAGAGANSGAADEVPA